MTVRTRVLQVAGLAIVGLVGAGCGPPRVVMLDSQIMALPAMDRHIQGTVVVSIDPQLANYWYSKYIGSELTTLQYPLGPATRDMLVNALTPIAERVVVQDAFAMQSAPSGATYTITPSILFFDETHPGAIRLGVYSARSQYRFVVQDRTGASVLDRTYTGDGAAQGRGTPRFEVNFAAPAAMAMKSAITQFVADLAQTYQASGP